MSDVELQVTYMEAREPPAVPPPWPGPECVALERLDRVSYLDLYRRVGAPLRWNQRLAMPPDELDRLLANPDCRIHVLRNGDGMALGFCEFDRGGAPDVELRNFGLVTEAQGRGLGPWLLASALTEEWRLRPRRIWLHTDTWDHPAAIPTYARAGFRTYRVAMEPAGPL